MNEITIEQRIQRLEDIEAIKTLKHTYAFHCDNGYDANSLAPLFTEDAVWDGGGLGVNKGREAIREFFSASPAMVPFAVHYLTNPIIEIDGDKAKGKWFLWEPMVFSEGNQAVWMSAQYSDEYVKINGEWMFNNVKIDIHMLSPYEDGFAKTRNLLEA